MPYIAGCEIHDHPLRPICRACRELVAERGDETPIAWLPREDRFVEKLATPDVTIADMIGDVDPIKAARGGRDLSHEMNIHYGLLPRANRGVFAINELPDLAGKIQVGLFNIMQEGDIQIKGYPIRLPLDVLLVFTANPEDYTARGKIVTPLKDRIGSEIRTHYPATVDEGMAITAQEAWTERDSGRRVLVPNYIRETVEQVAFLARDDKRVDKRSGVSQRLPIACMEAAISSAEQRAARNRETVVAARIADVYAAIPAMTGKLELEYEGELKGADPIARELIRAAVGKVFTKHLGETNFQPVVQWFESGGELKMPESASTSEELAALRRVHGPARTRRKARRERLRRQLLRPPPANSSSRASGPTSASAAMRSAASTPTAPSPPSRASRKGVRRAASTISVSSSWSVRRSREIHPLLELQRRARRRRRPRGADEAPRRLLPAERLRVAILRRLGIRSRQNHGSACGRQFCARWPKAICCPRTCSSNSPAIPAPTATASFARSSTA